jgi:catechol 2,3-dioxygenase-like lactoylglutathione lyase family enzyme
MSGNWQISGVRAVGVPVTDQDAALAFYTETLGFAVRADIALEQFGGRWIEVAPPDGTTTIALIPARPGLPAGVETGVRFTVTDAAAAHEALGSAGVKVGELLRWPGVPPMFAVADEDGNGFELTEEQAR